MDGIDGITAVETISLALGFALLGQFIPQSALLIAVSLGFLLWNWHPAKIFLGDSGSIPLGFLLGWLLLLLAGRGHWAAALILPAYYLADSTLTLLRRAVRGEKIWLAHRQHAYQRAVQAGARHDQVTLTILAANLLLIGAAWWSESQPWPALGLAMAVTAVTLFRLTGVTQRS
jgi:UDP-N-acetylmuramyl pentapeptide phosphotransferase/UDP-N-acetylglucosamine-1-phosphate transferase